MPCGAGRGPHEPCEQPDDGAVYAKTCPFEHAEEIRLCAFHGLWALMHGSPGKCTACWEADGSLVPVTITARETA